MSSVPDPKIQQAMGLALEYQRTGRLREAAAIYRRVLQADSDNADALHFLGVIAHRIGRPDLALELLARSVEADPSKVGFQLNLGNLYLKQQRLDDAIACYRAAIRHSPEYASAYAHLGNALHRQGKTGEAEAVIGRAWELRQKQGLAPLYAATGERGSPANLLPPLPQSRAVPEPAAPPEPPALPRFDPAADSVAIEATPAEVSVTGPGPVEPGTGPEWVSVPESAVVDEAAFAMPPAMPPAVAFDDAALPESPSAYDPVPANFVPLPTPPDPGPVVDVGPVPPGPDVDGATASTPSAPASPPCAEAFIAPSAPAAGPEFEVPTAAAPHAPPSEETWAVSSPPGQPPAVPDVPARDDSGPSEWALAREPETVSAAAAPAAPPPVPLPEGPNLEETSPPLSPPFSSLPVPAAVSVGPDPDEPGRAVEPGARVRALRHLEETAPLPGSPAETAGVTALAELLPEPASQPWPALSDETERVLELTATFDIGAVAPVGEPPPARGPGSAREPGPAPDPAPFFDRLFLGDGLADATGPAAPFSPTDSVTESALFAEPDFEPIEPALSPAWEVDDLPPWAAGPEVLLPELDEASGFAGTVAPAPDDGRTAEAFEARGSAARPVVMNALATPAGPESEGWDQVVLTDEDDEPEPAEEATPAEAVAPEAPPAGAPARGMTDPPAAFLPPDAPPAPAGAPPAPATGPTTATGEEALDSPVPPGVLGSAHTGPPPDLTHVATDRATIKQRLAAGWFAAHVPDPSAPPPPPGAPPAAPRPTAATPSMPSVPPMPGDPHLPGVFAPPAPAAAPNRRAPSAESLRSRAATMVGKRKLDEAVGMLTRAIALRPNFAEAHRDLGGALLRRGDMEAAIASLKRALELKPNFAEAWASLGDAYQLEGKVANAIRCYRRLLEIAPGAAKVHSNLLLTLNYDTRFAAPQVFREHLAWARRHAEPLTVRAAPHAKDRTRDTGPGQVRRDRRLRIGYVSPDFRRHSVNYFIEPVLAAHDRERFHVTCYSDVIRPDVVTKGLARLCDDFHEVRGLSDAKLAERIRADGIDILVDLSGHTGNNRLCAFARRPAPVQVTYLGYPNTTGMSAMDYRVTDTHADTPGRAESLHSERLVRMPETFLCYRPPSESPEVTPPPCLTTGYVTFGCFNILAKVTSEVLAVWAKAMLAAPGSRLVLKGRGGALAHESRRAFVRDTMVYHGVAADRLELLSKVKSYADHLGLYRRLDIVLDPFPYNGTTTTCEALWMGLPVVALAGDRHVSRVGVSILSNVGLADLITRTPEQYARVAAGLARSPQDLAALRSGLRQQMLRSPLTDAQRFTRALEERYREMWVKWCGTGGKEPEAGAAGTLPPPVVTNHLTLRDS